MSKKTTPSLLLVVPARWESSRFPGKPLALIGGKTMIQRVLEQCQKVPSATKIVAATDDERIFEAVERLGFEAVFTSKMHPSGTDRAAEAARFLKTKGEKFDLVVNVQGDEPFVRPEQIESLAQFLWAKNSRQIATLARRIDAEDDLFSANSVKVVFAEKSQKALYFSRSPIPFCRNFEKNDWLGRGGPFFKHIGLYAFRTSSLQKVSRLEPSFLEKTESLEQLRWLENGLEIGVLETDGETIGIDAPEDLARAEAFLKNF